MKKIISILCCITLILCGSIGTFAVAKDTRPPEVLRTNPGNNAVNININKTIMFVFNEEIVKGKTFSKIKLVDENNKTAIITVNINKTSLSVKHKINFAYGRFYTLTIPVNGVKDKTGNGLKKDIKLKFKTVSIANSRNSTPKTTPTPATPITFSDFQYSKNGAAITITKYIGKGGYVKIPANITGIPVKSIGNFAFDGCKNVTCVNIPDSVEAIGNLAFENCSSLEQVNIPIGVTNIGLLAFMGCTKLKSISIPNSVKEIGFGAFSKCITLKSVIIPASVTTIKGFPFSSCTELQNISVDRNNKNYTSIDGVLYDKCVKTLIQCPAKIDKQNFTIPIGVTRIESSAFDGCNNLQNVTLPSSVTSIGQYAFYGCSSLLTITIPKNVTLIEEKAFQGCTALIVRCYCKSYSEIYARDNGINIFLLDSGINTESQAASPSPADSNSSTELTFGNNEIHIVNANRIAVQSEWIYYADESGLYKFKSNDSDEKTLITTRFSRLINLIEDRIYFVGKDDYIYNIKNDGTDICKVSDERAGNLLFIIGDWIYFDVGANKLYKMKLDGSNKTEVYRFTYECILFNVNADKNYIYFTDWIQPVFPNASSANRIYKLNIKTSEVTKLNNEASMYLYVKDGWVYYKKLGNPKGFIKMKTDGSNKKEILSTINSSAFIVDNGWIYYYSGQGIYKADCEGNNIKKLSELTGACTNIYVAGKYIYCEDTNGEFYKMTIDGADKQLIGDR